MKTGHRSGIGTPAWPSLPTWSARIPFPGIPARVLRGHSVLGRDLWRAWLLWWPLPTLLLLLLPGAPGTSFWLVAFFTLVLLYPATLAASRIAGRRAGAVGGAAFFGLFALRLVLPVPSPTVQPAILERRFDLPTQLARHTIRLPLDSPTWKELWTRTPEPQAYLYFLISTRPGVQDPALIVRLADHELGYLSLQTRLQAPASTEPATTDQRHWHRLPVARNDLEKQSLLRVTVQPGPAFVSGAAGIDGTYSYRPTNGPSPSDFFDGERWTADPRELLPDAPGLFGAPSQPYRHPTSGAATTPLRYFVELRLIDPSTRRILSAYY